jgi:uncharacterized membrane protein
MLLAIHIAAGGLAIVLGAIALLAKKGGNIHRRSGLLFVYAMLVLGATAALLGFRKSPTDGNVFGGLMTVYFVLTALMTVRAVSPWTRRIMILAAIGDVRIMLAGMPRGGPRLARHLWRMCFALFIAAGSFFSIRARVAKILPAPFTTVPMRALPILLLFGAMFYWLWRVRSRRPLPVLVRA